MKTTIQTNWDEAMRILDLLRRPKRKNSRMTRSLRFEGLEDRHLMAADMLNVEVIPDRINAVAEVAVVAEPVAAQDAVADVSTAAKENAETSVQSQTSSKGVSDSVPKLMSGTADLYPGSFDDLVDSLLSVLVYEPAVGEFTALAGTDRILDSAQADLGSSNLESEEKAELLEEFDASNDTFSFEDGTPDFALGIDVSSIEIIDPFGFNFPVNEIIVADEVSMPSDSDERLSPVHEYGAEDSYIASRPVIVFHNEEIIEVTFSEILETEFPGT